MAMDERIYRVGGRDTRLEQNRNRQVFATLQARAEQFQQITVPLSSFEDSQLLLPRTLGAKARSEAEIKLLMRALQSESIDLFQAPVDSLPWELPSNVSIAAILKRQEARDVLAIRKDQSFSSLDPASRVFSQGLRREAQLEQLRSDLLIEETDLGLDDQLEALESGEVSAVVAAAADLVAIGMESYRASLSFRPFSLTAMVPAAGQGMVAVLCRKNDDALLELLRTHLEDEDSRLIYQAERACALALGLGSEEQSQYYAALHASFDAEDLYLLALSQRKHAEGPSRIRQRLNRSGERMADPALLEAVIQSLLGSCSFVGVDAHDPELISLKADRVMRDADHLLYPSHLRGLVELYSLPSSVTKVELSPQDNVPAKLAHLLRLGFDCVRLLEGDPFLYTPSATELSYLREQHLAVEVIPAASSLLAWPTYAGIPLVHPDVADQVHIYDGRSFGLHHTASSAGTSGSGSGSGSSDLSGLGASSLDRLLVPDRSSLLFYRAATRLPDIVAALKDAGFDMTKSAALITRGTALDQQVLEADLEALPSLAVQANVVDPAILIVGETTTLRKKLQWWPPLGPMHRMHFMELRTSAIMHERLELEGAIHRLGGRVYRWQLAREERRSYLDDQIASELIAALERKQASRRFDRNELWLALDGVGAVDALGRCLASLKLDHRLLAPVNIAVSDAASARALEGIGFEADYISATDDVDDMAAHLASILNASDYVLGISSESGHSVLSLVLQLADVPSSNLLYAEYIRERPNSSHFLDQLAQVDNIIFSDALAVREFSSLLSDLGMNVDSLAQSSVLFFASSADAEQMALSRGIPLAATPSTYETEQLVDLLKAKARVRD